MNLPDTATHRNRRLISSETSTRQYTLSQRITTGAWECSCPGWTTHRKCKHLPKKQARKHWMCVTCQRALRGEGRTPFSADKEKGNCCWCGVWRTGRVAPTDMTPPCQDVHLEDVT